MQRWTSLTVLLLVLLGWTLGTSGAQETPKNDGKELLRRCTAALRALAKQQGETRDGGWCMGHVSGFIDGYLFAVHGTCANQPGVPVRFDMCPPAQGVSAEQLAQILVAWLRTHPSLLHMSRPALTLAAFADAFPCPSAVAPPPQQTPSIAPQPATPKAGKGK